MAETAVEDAIASFRLTTGISEKDLSDDDLEILLSENDLDISLTAAAHFDREAAKYSKLVDVSESGSSRSLGQLYKAATAMADRYRARASEASGSTPTRVARTRAMIRPES